MRELSGWDLDLSGRLMSIALCNVMYASGPSVCINALTPGLEHGSGCSGLAHLLSESEPTIYIFMPSQLITSFGLP